MFTLDKFHDLERRVADLERQLAEAQARNERIAEFGVRRDRAAIEAEAKLADARKLLQICAKVCRGMPVTPDERDEAMSVLAPWERKLAHAQAQLAAEREGVKRYSGKWRQVEAKFAEAQAIAASRVGADPAVREVLLHWFGTTDPDLISEAMTDREADMAKFVAWCNENPQQWVMRSDVLAALAAVGKHGSDDV